MERKKTSLMILGVCALVLSVIGVTYAFWQLRLAQKDQNTIGSSCFDVKLENEGKAITLNKAYPILDSDVEELEPYTFIIANKCDANASYQINLESLTNLNNGSEVENRLDEQYLKVKLNEVGEEGSIQELTEENKVDATLVEGKTEGLARADKGYKLETGYLGPKEEKHYELRIWLKGSLTIDDVDAMNKTYASKITVTTTYLSEDKIPPVADLELTLCENNIIAQGKGTASGNKKILSYEFKIDEDANWTSNQAVATKKFTELDPGSHTVSIKVTDSEGMTNETSQTIEVNYVEPTTATLGGKTINLVTEGNGLYKVGHCDVTGTVDDIGFSKEEYRYAGVNYAEGVEDYVHNYVWFNSDDGCTSEDGTDGKHCEKWRIIGLVNVQTKSGITQRLKIVKSSPVANDHWDDENNANDWTKASLMKKLNEINGEKGEYYQKLKDTAINMISDDIIWNIGGTGDYDTKETGLAKHFYGYERGTSTGNGNTYPSTWPAQQEGGTYENIIARVGLIYPSDYGYAVGGTKENRDTCLDTDMYNWNTVSNCNSNDWLQPSSGDTWTISPFSSHFDSAFIVDWGGYVGGGHVHYLSIGVAPVVYLKENVHIKDNGNDGSYENPYTLSVQ